MAGMQRMRGLKAFLTEARRRRVFRLAGLYVVAAWVAVQVCSEAFPALDIPPGAIRYVWLGAAVGFPLALLFSWFYDVTTTGIVRTPPAEPGAEIDLGLRRTDFAVLAALAVVGIAIVLQVAGRVRSAAPMTDGGAALPSLAVLPPAHAGNDADQGYFAQGMHDALITALGKIGGLRVISRSSTVAYAGTDLDAAAFGRALGATNVLQAEVERNAGRVRIEVRLVDAAGGDPVWASVYERDMADVLVLQSDIARGVARQIEVQLTDAESIRLAGARPVDPAAYEAYLKGAFHVERFTPQDMQLAVSWFERAIALDPELALAYWGLNRVCRYRLQAGLVRPREAAPRCREPLLRAMEIDASLAEVHLGIALGSWLYDYDWPAAEAAFRRALAINPNHAEARMFFGHFLAHMGRPDESNRQVRIARELDPLNVFIEALHAAQQLLIGNPAVAVTMLDDVLERMPDLGFGYDVLWFANSKIGDPDAAYEAARRQFGVTMGLPEVAAAIEEGYRAGGYEAAMRAGAARAEAVAQTRYVPGVEIAVLHEEAGDVDRAIAWLETAYAQHDTKMAYLNTAPPFDRLREDPRYADLLQRLKFDR